MYSPIFHQIKAIRWWPEGQSWVLCKILYIYGGITDTLYRQYEMCCVYLCDFLVSSTICFALCLKVTVKIHFISCCEFRKTELCMRSRRQGTHKNIHWTSGRSNCFVWCDNLNDVVQKQIIIWTYYIICFLLSGTRGCGTDKTRTGQHVGKTRRKPTNMCRKLLKELSICNWMTRNHCTGEWNVANMIPGTSHQTLWT